MFNILNWFRNRRRNKIRTKIVNLVYEDVMTTMVDKITQEMFPVYNIKMRKYEGLTPNKYMFCWQVFNAKQSLKWSLQKWTRKED